MALAATSACQGVDAGGVSEPRGSAAQRLVDELPAQAVAANPLTNVAAIVEADVVKSWEAYDDRLGPRTYYQLANAVAHAGQLPNKLVFSQYGGRLPDGRFAGVSGQPTISQGAKYIFFFGKRASLYSAVWGDFAFRVETVGNREVVLGGPGGNMIMAFDVRGPRYGSKSLVESSGEATTRLAPKAFNKLTAAADPEGSKALSKQAFIDSAVQATQAIGGVLGEPVNFDPPDGVKWNSTPVSEAP